MEVEIRTGTSHLQEPKSQANWDPAWRSSRNRQIPYVEIFSWDRISHLARGKSLWNQSSKHEARLLFKGKEIDANKHISQILHIFPDENISVYSSFTVLTVWGLRIKAMGVVNTLINVSIPPSLQYHNDYITLLAEEGGYYWFQHQYQATNSIKTDGLNACHWMMGWRSLTDGLNVCGAGIPAEQWSRTPTGVTHQGWWKWPNKGDSCIFTAPSTIKNTRETS